MDELRQFLRDFNLSQYYNALKAEGADNLGDLRDLNDDEATEVAANAKLKPIHRRKFVKAVNNLRNGNYTVVPAHTTSKAVKPKRHEFRSNPVKKQPRNRRRRPQIGVIAMYNHQKGFGFISHGDGPDVYFHRSGVQSQSQNTSLRKGQTVSFAIVTQKKGRTKAVNVCITEPQINFRNCSVNQLKTWLTQNTDSQQLQTFYFELEANTEVFKSILSRNGPKLLEEYIGAIYEFIGQKALLNPSPLYQNIFSKKIDTFYIDTHGSVCQLLAQRIYYSAVESYQIIILQILIKLFTLIPHGMTLMSNWSIVIKHINKKHMQSGTIIALLKTLNGLLHNSETEIEEENVNTIENEVNDTDVKQEMKEIENINDFLDINVLPNSFIDFITEPTDLPIISKDKGYVSSKHLLRTHTLLMREDVMSALRNGVTQEIAHMSSKYKPRNLSIRKYSNVRIDHFFENEKSEIMYNISFEHHKMQWKYSKKLIYGSLVLLLHKNQLQNLNKGNDDNIDMIWCTVADRDIKYLERKRPSISLQLRKGIISTEHLGTSEFIMFESSDAYFVPYEHVINGLQTLGKSVDIGQENEILPFENVLVSADTDIALPSYLTNESLFNFKCILDEPVSRRNNEEKSDVDDLWRMLIESESESESYMFSVVQDWPKNLKTSLDDSQLMALKHILTNEVALIQGPPGTGKTYLALKALNILLTNLGRDKKIVVAALTNHALDQLLCGILRFEENIIRIGSRSQCEQLDEYSIRSRKKQYLWGKGVRSDAAKEQFHELRKEREQLLYDLDKLYKELNGAVFDDKMYLKYEIIPKGSYGKMKQKWNQWSQRKHTIDYQLYSLSRLYNKINGFNAYNNNQYNNNEYNESNNQSSDNMFEADQNYNGNQSNEYNNHSKWQVVGAKKRRKKAEKINQMFDNYDVQSAFELYINEPFFAEKIKMKRKEINNSINQKRFAAFGLTPQMIEQNLKIEQMKPTTKFIMFEHIPVINPNIIEEETTDESKEESKEEKKDSEINELSDENEIELMMEERKYLDNAFGIEITDKEKLKYKQSNRLNNRMVKRDWDFFNVQNTEQMQRIAQIKKYENDLEIAIKQAIEEKLKEVRIVNKQMKHITTLIETQLLQKSRVIGITTTAAARLMDVINEIKPEILIFEEAAEILESHIVTALSTHLKHLILIGDHKQLRPTAATYKLVTENNLEISLFERLILSGISHQLLSVQRRMIPQICELSSFHYNNENFAIQNHESTLEREDIEGMCKNVIFFNHSHHEKQDQNIQSPYNMFEAEMVIELVIYLLKQEMYTPSNITILTGYRGQQLKIQLLTRENAVFQRLLQQWDTVKVDAKSGKPHKIPAKIDIKCVDKYQGEENDIIILSFVRSNTRGKIGFLSIDNRICVALSRAKNGLFAFGNFDLYAKESKTWETIVNIATKNDFLQDKIELKCKRHSTVITIKQPKDFQLSPEGGCSQKCGQRMECGHVCLRLCHSYEHKWIQCLKACAVIHDRCKHTCPKVCYQDCGECEVIVTKTMPICAHINGVRCCDDVRLIKCQRLVTYNDFADCNHSKEINCHQRNTEIECDALINIAFKNCKHQIKNVKCKDKRDAKYTKCGSKCEQTLECGHKCSNVCFECNEQKSIFEPVEHKCGFVCNRIMVCGHECERMHNCKHQCPPCDRKCENECPHSKCNKKCGEPCVVCKEKCTRLCAHHKCTAMCSEKCNFIRCNRACREILECGHKCPGVCGEDCLPFCSEQKCAYLDENDDCFVFDQDFIPRPIHECTNESTFIVLTDCGHIIERTAIDHYVSDYTKNNSEKIKLVPCPLCKTPIRKCKRFINITNDILKDIEYVKKQIFDNQFEAVKSDIVNAMSGELGGNKGHWFKCSKGHYYVVGECGGPMETAKCPECDEIIGGNNHQIANGSQLASEMDGAVQPKWTTALQRN